jgi:pyruvate,water dikinase
MYRELASQGVKIPNGFAVTAEAYRYVIESARILDELKDAMPGLACVDEEPAQKRSQVIVSKEARNAKR